MFEACTSLEEIIGIENWDVSNASYYAFSETFHCCYNLKSLNLTTWDTSSADNMARMFAKCKSLTTLDLSNFDISNVTTMKEMFNQSPNLTEIIGIEDWDLTNIDTSDMY